MLNHRRKMLSFFFIGGGLLLLLAGMVWVLQDQASAPIASTTPLTAGEVQRVDLADAKTAFETGAAVFVDVRDSVSFAASHIPGARSIPVNELAARMNELDPSSWIITYCT